MTLSESRWQAIHPSSFPWEREALEFVRQHLPDRSPYRAWSNFEFVAQDGSINEVDLLVLGAEALFLVEIKSRPGEVRGDAGTWTWSDAGRTRTLDNPLLLADRKAKRLASLLQAQKPFQRESRPYVQALVFCSSPALRLSLDERARQHVVVRDEPTSGEVRASSRPGVIARLTATPALPASRPRIDARTERAISQALEHIGIRPTQRARTVGDFKLDKLIGDGPGWQDWAATHVALEKTRRRVRLYPIAAGTGTLSRRTLERAAQREFQILEGVRHPGVVPALAFTQSERGPAIVFEYDPREVRLDLFLREHADRLSLDARLSLLRQVGEALKYAHEHKLYHRALSPHSILVSQGDKPEPRARLFNWQTGRRDPGSSAPPGTPATRTTHLGELIEEAARVYVAPEALRHSDADPEPLDVFSLGALAYLLFTGRAPAADALELGDKLRTEHGLRVDLVMDAAGRHLQDLVFFATCGDVGTRMASVDEFLAHLTAVEDELTTPERPAPADPLEATKGDRLEGGFEVLRRLGKGSSALALLVEREGREAVLKIALAPEHDERLRVEGEVLGALHHQHVCKLHEVLHVGGRMALLMAPAGEQTLAQRLRDEVRLHVDLLERFGEDLLDTLDALEQQGVAHRDVKPDNIGVAVGRGDRLHLVLFDFSLTRTPAENVRAGTVPYLDPFLRLRKPPRWDAHAERFAAAMTLHEMATGTLPVWGDGRSDPAVIEDEVTLEPARFDPDLRAPLTDFFRRALARDYRERFGNTREMLNAWRDVFRAAVRPAPAEAQGELLLGEALAVAALDTPLGQLGLGTRALNALDRAGVVDVRGLVALPAMAVAGMRGVGDKTRREISLVKQRLLARFPDVAARTPRRPTTDRRASDEPAPPEPTAGGSLDVVAEALLPPARGKKTSESVVLEALLGFAPAAPIQDAAAWPSQIDVARALGLTRARVGQIVAKARARWASDARVQTLAADVAELLPLRGGVMSAAELAGALLTARGSLRAGSERLRLAAAVARALVEAEQAHAAPRFTLTRRNGALLVATRDELADYALRLGKKADELAREDPPAAPLRVVDELRRVPAPEGGEPLAPARLVALAAAASQTAAVSSRLELYPRGLDAPRALRLAHGALLGVALLTPDEVSKRVLGRYPEAQALPARPALDDLLSAAGLDLVWDDAQRAYRSRTRPASSSVSAPARWPTTSSKPGEVTPDVAEARQFHARLTHAWEHGGFLALGVEPRAQHDAERELRRHFDLERRSFEELLIAAMRARAHAAGVQWDVVRRADAAPRASADWRNLLSLARDASASVERELAATDGRVLLVHPGLVARYDLIEMLGRLRDALDRPGALHALWVLVPADASHERPVLEGRPVPVLSPGQWARIPDAWLQNRHRGHAPHAA